MMQLINRSIIHPDYTITCHNATTKEEYDDEQLVVYDRNKIVELIDKWRSVFKKYNLKKGDVISTTLPFDGRYLALFIAACESQLMFGAYQIHEYMSDADYASRGLNLKFLVGDNDINMTSCQWDVVRYDASRLESEDVCPPSREVISEHFPVYVSRTSGTTGKPTDVRHSHKTMLSSARKAAKLLYSSGDKTLLVNHLHHAGVMSMQVLPSVMAGVECHFVHYDTAALFFDWIRPSKIIMFPPQFYQIKYSFTDLWESIDLQFVDTIITGGSLITREFVSELLGKGVKKIYDVYGLTQCLAPVMYSCYTSENFEEMFDKPNSGKFTNVADGWNCRLDDEGVLFLKGDSVGQIQHNGTSPYTEDGYFCTEDIFEKSNGNFYYRWRKDKFSTMRTINDEVISSSSIVSAMSRYNLDGRNGVVVRLFQDRENNIIMMAVLGPGDTGENLTLEKINTFLAKELDHSHCVQKIVIGTRNLKLSAIKF